MPGTLTSTSSTPPSVVAPARPLWLVAAGTGAATALLAMVGAVAAVAATWLPVSSGTGNAASAIRAGVLTFLAALHAGIVVDGVPTAFVPLGMTLLVALLCWRAGQALAVAAADRQEPGPGSGPELRRLGVAAACQAAAFALVAGIAAHAATLGSTSVAAVPAAAAGLVLFAISGTVAFVRSSALGAALGAVVPATLPRIGRGAAVALAVQAAAASLLVAGSLVVHHHAVTGLSRHVGGGWSGVPVLLLGLLAAPNAVLAGSAYLTGPGFALGTGSHVSFLAVPHGVLPGFPLLGAVPVAHPSNVATWVLAGAAPLVAGTLTALCCRPAASLLRRLGDCAGAALLAGGAAAALGWQGGGAIGRGRLHAFGASPWQFGAAMTVELAVSACMVTALLAAVQALRVRRAGADDAGTADAPTMLGDVRAAGARAALSLVHAVRDPRGSDADHDPADDLADDPADNPADELADDPADEPPDSEDGEDGVLAG